MVHVLIDRTNTTQVAIIYSSSTNAEAVASEIASSNGVRCKAYKANVTSAEEIDAALKQITTDFERLDIMVANAGIATHHAAEDDTPDQFHEVMKVNLDGAFWTAQAAARIFKAQGSGNLIFTASVSAILVNVPQKQSAVRIHPSIGVVDADIGEVQRIQSRFGAIGKVSCGRVGRLLPSELYFTRLHCH